MDLTNPARSLCAPVPADVIVVLASSHRALTGSAVARLAARSYAQVHEVLQRLAEAGLVEAEKAGQATLYALNREHVLADAVTVLSTAHRVLVQRIVEHVASWPDPPVTVSLFGSAARRDGTPSSDIDLLLVRPATVSSDDDRWLACRHELAQCVDRWSGNPTQVIELSVDELRSAARRGDPLIDSLSLEAQQVWGSPVSELVGPKSG